MSTLQFDTAQWMQTLEGTELEMWAEALAQSVLTQGHALKHGHLANWEQAVSRLPSVTEANWSVQHGVVSVQGHFNSADQAVLHTALADLMPWRKGPFSFGPLLIDTEWRSDWKWDRIAPHLQPLTNRVVLDVGCGNGYHLWRIRHAGAALVLGIDPSLLYLQQFNALQHYARDAAVHLLPLPMEALPSPMHSFDTVFSMGVLYHRRDPQPHLQALRQALKPGGELVLETLIYPAPGDVSLAISDRYANMRNVYELPSITRLENWVNQAGFQQVQTLSSAPTSRLEQRSTAWMTTHSLDKALDPADETKTVEGYPRPHRAVLLASA